MINVNDSVKVKPGIKNPDDGITDLGGWQGRVTEIDPSDPQDVLVTIAWDSETLRQMPVSFIEASMEEGYDYAEMTLGVDEVEPAIERDTEQGRQDAIQSVEQEHSWADLGAQGKRIQAVENACKHDFDLMDHWFEHLENHVELPVKAKYIGESSQNLRYGAEILINGFSETDNHYGVIGSAKYQNRAIQVLLCDTEVLESSPKTQALEDYIVWFVNR